MFRASWIICKKTAHMWNRQAPRVDNDLAQRKWSSLTNGLLSSWKSDGISVAVAANAGSRRILGHVLSFFSSSHYLLRSYGRFRDLICTRVAEKRNLLRLSIPIPIELKQHSSICRSVEVVPVVVTYGRFHCITTARSRHLDNTQYTGPSHRGRNHRRQINRRSLPAIEGGAGIFSLTFHGASMKRLVSQPSHIPKPETE